MIGTCKKKMEGNSIVHSNEIDMRARVPKHFAELESQLKRTRNVNYSIFLMKCSRVLLFSCRSCVGIQQHPAVQYCTQYCKPHPFSFRRSGPVSLLIENDLMLVVMSSHVLSFVTFSITLCFVAISRNDKRLGLL